MLIGSIKGWKVEKLLVEYVKNCNPNISHLSTYFFRLITINYKICNL